MLHIFKVQAVELKTCSDSMKMSRIRDLLAYKPSFLSWWVSNIVLVVSRIIWESLLYCCTLSEMRTRVKDSYLSGTRVAFLETGLDSDSTRIQLRKTRDLTRLKIKDISCIYFSVFLRWGGNYSTHLLFRIAKRRVVSLSLYPSLPHQQVSWQVQVEQQVKLWLRSQSFIFTYCYTNLKEHGRDRQ